MTDCTLCSGGSALEAYSRAPETGQPVVVKLAILMCNNVAFECRACYGVLRFIMESGAKGCEVIVSGKLRAQRAKAMKFKVQHALSADSGVTLFVAARPTLVLGSLSLEREVECCMDLVHLIQYHVWLLMPGCRCAGWLHDLQRSPRQ